MMSAAAKAVAADKHVEYTIELLNSKLCDGTVTADEVLQLFDLCMPRNKKEIAHLCLTTGMFLCSMGSLSARQSLDMALKGERSLALQWFGVVWCIVVCLHCSGFYYTILC
jgi:hypothetical protein